MKMEKKKFRIGHLADELGVERFVIRFWEKEFNVKPNRSEGGQRFYQQEDLDQFKKIKELLYSKGFTIAGAKKLLNNDLEQSEEKKIIGSQKTTFETKPIDKEERLEKLFEELDILKHRLITLQKLL